MEEEKTLSNAVREIPVSFTVKSQGVNLESRNPANFHSFGAWTSTERSTTSMFEALFNDALKKRKEDPPSTDGSKQQKKQKKKRPRPTKKVQPKHTPPQQQQQHKSKIHKRPRRRGPPSPETLELSRQLKELSRHKRLADALQLYHQSPLADEHHACIVVDCCGRCGGDHMDTAQAIVDALPKPINIETYTALLKGYASAGHMETAMRLFRELCTNKDTHRRPNVRTLNTILRGCLWTCATLNDSGDVVGGVMSSEEAWALCSTAQHQKQQPAQDPSAVEYSVSLLCQALRVPEALSRVDAFLRAQSIRTKGKAKFIGGDQISLETLAVVYLKLATAYALLGDKEQVLLMCQKSLSANRLSKALLLAASEHPMEDTNDIKNTRRGMATGGKQSWNNNSQNHRSASNTTFRSHRLEEVERDVKQLLQHRDQLTANTTASTTSEPSLIHFLTTQCFYFGGGSSTGRTKNKRNVSGEALLAPLWHSFGLSRLLLGPSSSQQQDDADDGDDDTELWHRYTQHVASHLAKKDGALRFDRIFCDTANNPIEIEVGSGFGSWIVEKARAHPDTNYVAVELRADRVGSTIARATGGGRPKNLCIVGSECSAFLEQRVAPGTVATFYANHPEPPTQTVDPHRVQRIASGGAATDEPSHMLTSTTLAAMARCLVPTGAILLTTDNRNYARLLLATAQKVMRNNKLLRSMTPEEAREQYALQPVDDVWGSGGTTTVHLYQHPRATTNGSSYFDRLWQSGASQHAERSVRFCVALRR